MNLTTYTLHVIKFTAKAALNYDYFFYYKTSRILTNSMK